jgi:undecaprenyl-diphosphatase
MHITLLQALLLGLLQGVAELFPISSLAQTILIPRLLGWDIGQGSENADYLAFVVALHLATAVALVIYYRNDWAKVVHAFVGAIPHRKLVYDRESKFAWLLVAGTVVVGAFGFIAEKPIRHIFDDKAMAWIVGAILVANGCFMIFGDWVKRQASKKNPAQPEHVPPPSGADAALHAAFIGKPLSSNVAAAAGDVTPRYAKRAEDLTFTQATFVGAAQTAALLPGVSRSGVTIVGGLFAGLTYEEATRFSFMLATPVIGLAAILKVPKLIKPPKDMIDPAQLQNFHDIQKLALYSSGVAFVAAYLSIKFLVRYFHSNRLSPFGYFCIAFGLFAAVWLKMTPADAQQNLTQPIGQNSSTQVVQENPPTTR